MDVVIKNIPTSIDTTSSLVVKKQVEPEKPKNTEIITPVIKDESTVTTLKKASISENEVVKFVDNHCDADKTNNDKYYDRTTLLTSFVLSTAKASPAVVAPLRIFSNGIFLDNMHDSIDKSLKEKNYVNLTTASLNSGRGAWWTFLSSVSLAKVSNEFATKHNLLPTKATSFVSNQLAKTAPIISKLSMPVSVVGIAISGVDFAKENSKLNERKEMLKNIETLKADPCSKNSENLLNAEKKLKADIKVIKVNTGIKGASLALSAISTGALVVALKKPQLAKTAGAISLYTSLASVSATLFSDAGYRKATGEFVSDTKNKLYNLVN